MTPAEIAALRERLFEHREKAVHAMLGRGVKLEACALADDLRSALALLDAQAADLARLTAERERAWADAIEAAARWHDALAAEHEDNARYWGGPDHMGNAQKAREHREYAAGIRALLAPAPAAEVAG